MELESHFSKIREKILAELATAKDDVTVAVAWVTDRDLFEGLIAAARRGCRVRLALLDDQINRTSGLNLERLRAANGLAFWIPPADKSEGSHHHKFCVIDGQALITGSYNWTRRASLADENIMIVRGSPELASGYLEAFETLLAKHGYLKAAPPIDSIRLKQRLAVLLGLVQLADHEAIATQMHHLMQARGLPNVAELVDFIGHERWEEAEQYLLALIPRLTSLVPADAEEIAQLRLELKTLEAQIVAFAAEYAELEHRVTEFSRRQQIALGDVLNELLDLRRQQARRVAERTRQTEDQRCAADAEQDYRDFQESREAFEREEKPADLSSEENEELTRLYRKAAQRCHPDRVGEADKKRAEEFFVRLKQAYDRNDLETVRRIYSHLVDRKPFADLSETTTTVDQLRCEVARLRIEVEQKIADINALRSGETFKQLDGLADWDTWFSKVRAQMMEECEQLRREIDDEAGRHGSL